MLTAYLENRFHVQPQGMWLAERVWEPSLPSTLADAAYDWTIVDDIHFRAASVPPDRALGPYSSDDQGRRIEVKGRTRGYSIRLTTNEWYKATQLGDSYWLYVVWEPLGSNPELVVIRNPAAKLDHAKKEIVAARYYDIPAAAIDEKGQVQ